MVEHQVKLSKFLSLVLRHKPETIGVTLDENGWIDVDTLLAGCNAHGTKITRTELEQIVANSDKQRFALTQDKSRIRANQGHSIDVELGYEPATPPATLYHGTATRFVEAIMEEGLRKQQRTHVHLSADVDTASKVGTRHGKLALLVIDADTMHRDGYQFFLSQNGVWLTEKVPPQYIRRQCHSSQAEKSEP